MAIFTVEELRNAPLNSVVDAGWYLVKIVSAIETASKQKQTPEVRVEYEIEAGPSQIDGRIIEGRHLTDSIYFPIGKSHDISKATVKKICLKSGVDLGSLGSEDDVYAELPGRELKVRVEHEMYKGEPQERIKGYAAANETSN